MGARLPIDWREGEGEGVRERWSVDRRFGWVNLISRSLVLPVGIPVFAQGYVLLLVYR